MNATLLLFLWFSCCRTSATHERPPPASLMVDPNRSQFREYESVSISCEQFGPDEWTVWRYTESGLQVSQCGSGWGVQSSSICSISTLKKPFSGVYWCESKQRDSSNTVNITVTDVSVILQSPVLPVTEGEDVTLRCHQKDGAPEMSASFFKDGSYIGTEPTGQMTLHKVSRSNEGGYKCEINGNSSPTSWLLIKDVSKLPVSLTMSPDSSQLFEYESFSLSCSSNSTAQGWTIKRFPTNRKKISSCGGDWGKLTSSGCTFQTAKKPDSALYWCESPSKQRSNTVHVAVYDSAVILQSPALPVKSGGSVTLSCLTKNPSNLPAVFHKDGSLIRTEPSGHMTLHPVSTSDEGSYNCGIQGLGESPSSWMFVRASDEPSPPAMSSLNLVLHVAAWSSYIYPTYRIISLFRHRPTGPVRTSEEEEQEGGADYDDVTATVTTEHRF